MTENKTTSDKKKYDLKNDKLDQSDGDESDIDQSDDNLAAFYPEDDDILSPRKADQDFPHKIDAEPVNDAPDPHEKKDNFEFHESTVLGFFSSKQNHYQQHNLNNHPLIKILTWLFVDFPHSRLKKMIPPLFYGWLVSLGFQPKNHTFLALIGLLGFYRHCEKRLFCSSSNSAFDDALSKDKEKVSKFASFRSFCLGSQAFSAGYWFGFSYFLGGLYWIVYALHIDWEQFIAVIPLILVGIPGILAIGMGGVTYATSLIAHSCSESRIASASPLNPSMSLQTVSPLSRFIALCAFCLFWSLWDYTRGHVFTGFPWLTLGELWLCGDVMVQTLSLIGTYGLGLLTLILFSSLYVLIFFAGQYRKLSLVFFLGLGSLCLFYGQWYINTNQEGVYDDFQIVMVQPNIHQTEKWDPPKLSQNVEQLVRLAKQSNLQPLTATQTITVPKLYIWPEASVPFLVESGSKIAVYITQFLRPEDFLIIGYNRLEATGKTPNAIGETPSEQIAKQAKAATEYQDNDKQFNSLAVLNHKGEILTTYDKAHLVPFGEYIPFRNIIPSFIDTLAPGTGDFSVGSGIKTLTLNGFPSFSPLICYEAIFAGDVISKKAVQPEKRPKWLLNLTNDGWYLGSAGIYQHLHITRMRTIEEGMPLVRVNYRGISAVFDSRGRMTADILFDHAEAKVINLPKPNQNLTVYARFGDRIYYALMLLLCFIMFGFIIRQKQ